MFDKNLNMLLVESNEELLKGVKLTVKAKVKSSRRLNREFESLRVFTSSVCESYFCTF